MTPNSPTVTVECSGDSYALNDVLDYLQMRSANPFLEAAHEFLLLQQTEATTLRTQLQEANTLLEANTGAFGALRLQLQQARTRLQEETRAAAEAEREKLALHEELRGLRADHASDLSTMEAHFQARLADEKQIGPLPFPAHKPAATEEQYFCLCGPDDVALLMWLDPSTGLLPDEQTKACWCEWDGSVYEPTQHLVRGFWPHPKAPKSDSAALPLQGEEGKGGVEVCQCGAVGYGFGACAWCEVAQTEGGKEAASE